MSALQTHVTLTNLPCSTIATQTDECNPNFTLYNGYINGVNNAIPNHLNVNTSKYADNFMVLMVDCPG